MPRKKGQKAQSVKPLSQMEGQIKQTQLENEMLDSVLKEREKRLKKLEEMKARERLLLNEGPLPGEGDNGEGEEIEGLPEPRHRFMSPRGIEREQQEMLQKQESFEKILSDFGDTQGRVEVYRLKDGVYHRMGSINANEWSDGLEGVAKRYGGGTFKVRLRAPDGSFAGETIVPFDEDAYPKPSEKAQLLPAIVQAPDQSAMLRVITEMNERSNERQMMMMKTMMESMAAMSNNKPSSMLNNMNDLMAFKEMLAEKKNPANELGTLVSVLQKGMELGQSAAPAEGGILDGLLSKILSGDTIARVAQALAPATQPQAEGGADNPPPPPPAPRRQLPAPAAQGHQHQQQQQAVRQNPPPAKREDDKMNLAVMMYKPVILGYAKNKVAPEKVAKMIVARIAAINEGWLIIVDDFLKLPDTKAKFVYSYAPELKPADKWVDAVMSEMAKTIQTMYQEAEVERPAKKAAAAKKPADKKPAPAPAEKPEEKKAATPEIPAP